MDFAEHGGVRVAGWIAGYWIYFRLGIIKLPLKPAERMQRHRDGKAGESLNRSRTKA